MSTFSLDAQVAQHLRQGLGYKEYRPSPVKPVEQDSDGFRTRGLELPALPHSQGRPQPTRSAMIRVRVDGSKASHRLYYLRCIK